MRKNGYVCDHCGTFATVQREGYTDVGPGEGWWILYRSGRVPPIAGSGNVDLCSSRCLEAWAAKKAAAEDEAT